MIFNNTYPLILDDDPMCAVTHNDTRIVPLIRRKERLLMRHTQIHMLDLVDTPLHDEVCNELGLVQTMLNACWVSPLN